MSGQAGQLRRLRVDILPCQEYNLHIRDLLSMGAGETGQKLTRRNGRLAAELALSNLVTANGACPATTKSTGHSPTALAEVASFLCLWPREGKVEAPLV